MKTRNTLFAALFLAMLAASSCATLNTAAVEQEEIITQIQKDQPAVQSTGRWTDANGWEYQGMGDDDND